ncbi:hypothetical protein TorRG33x02_136790 [Trema orientale]|uniref:Uncharacterized protein n=1 Tax=Trema orientale TaxID=63057 RepID=A0A2P5EYL6_TREOI|nr:hypothetical protein TorRG33x02_136790 [Trema orientale]
MAELGDIQRPTASSPPKRPSSIHHLPPSSTSTSSNVKKMRRKSRQPCSTEAEIIRLRSNGDSTSVKQLSKIDRNGWKRR